MTYVPERPDKKYKYCMWALNDENFHTDSGYNCWVPQHDDDDEEFDEDDDQEKEEL